MVLLTQKWANMAHSFIEKICKHPTKHHSTERNCLQNPWKCRKFIQNRVFYRKKKNGHKNRQTGEASATKCFAMYAWIQVMTMAISWLYNIERDVIGRPNMNVCQNGIKFTEQSEEWGKNYRKLRYAINKFTDCRILFAKFDHVSQPNYLGLKCVKHKSSSFFMPHLLTYTIHKVVNKESSHSLYDLYLYVCVCMYTLLFGFPSNVHSRKHLK